MESKGRLVLRAITAGNAVLVRKSSIRRAYSSRIIDIRRGQMSDGEAKTELIEAINRGQKIVNYSGHGSVDLWRAGLLTSADASLLQNSDHLSLFVLMNCLNGYFDDPVLDSLAEAMMKAPEGGAVAVSAS